MKKLLLTAAVFLFVFTALHGQYAGKFALGARIGFQVGINAMQDDYKNWIDKGFSPSLKSQPLPNFVLVFLGEYGFTNQLGLQTEFNFNIAQGQEARADSSYEQMTYSSLDIPILLKVNFLNSDNRFGILAGPYLTFPLGKVTTKYSGIVDRYGRNIPDESNPIETPNLGFTAGLYGSFLKYILVDLRFITDFGVSKEKFDNGTYFKFMRRQGIIFSIGGQYTF